MGRELDMNTAICICHTREGYTTELLLTRVAVVLLEFSSGCEISAD